MKRTKNKNQRPTTAEPEAIKPEIVLTMPPESVRPFASDNVKPPALDLKRGGNIVIGTLNIFAHPVKKRWEKHYHPKNKNWHWHLLVDSLLFLIIIGLVAINLVLFFGPAANLNENLNLSITTEPKEVISGQDLTFIINYTNGTKIRLNDVRLAFKWPEKFKPQEILPATAFNRQTNTFDLGEIDSGGNGELKIKGVIYGVVGENQKITATLNYLPENGKSRRQKTSSVNFNVAKSSIAAQLTVPAKVWRGQPFAATIHYFNDSPYDLPEITIKPELGGDWELISSSWPLTDQRWVIKNLKANTAGQIDFSGRINSETTGIFTIKMPLAIVVDEKIWPQAEINQATEISHSKFSLAIKSEAANLTAGQEAAYIITYKNGEDFSLENVRVTANIEGWLAAAKKITWDKSQVPALAKIDAGQEGEIKFNFQTRAQVIPTAIEQKNLTLTISPSAIYDLPKPENLTGFSAGQKLTQKITTNLNLQAVARYYTEEGDQLGIGPLPPIVGTPTKYWIFFNLQNFYNDAKNITLTANLGQHVSWTGKTSTTADQGVIYNQGNNQISWQVNLVKAPSNFYPDLGAAFEVALTPTADQAGQLANLVENIQISGVDDFTGENLSQEIAPLTTALELDKNAKNKGKVKN